MTQRERQILQLIEANPMISQQELANALGITRSSAGVHISNMTRKGIIAGKGYMGCCKYLMSEWTGVDFGPARLPMGKQDKATLEALKSELKAIGFYDWAIYK